MTALTAKDIEANVKTMSFVHDTIELIAERRVQGDEEVWVFNLPQILAANSLNLPGSTSGLQGIHEAVSSSESARDAMALKLMQWIVDERVKLEKVNTQAADSLVKLVKDKS